MIFQAGEVENSGILKKVQMIYVFFTILSLKYRELPGYIGIGWNGMIFHPTKALQNSRDSPNPLPSGVD